MSTEAEVIEKEVKPKEPAEGLLSKRRKKIISDPLNEDNPITVQVLGICSALAITIKMEPTLVMSIAVIFVIVFSNLIISLIRNPGSRKGQDYCPIGCYRYPGNPGE